MPKAASATSLDPVVLASSVFRRFNLWMLDDYGVHAAARRKRGFNRTPFRLLMPAGKRLSRCLFVISTLITRFAVPRSLTLCRFWCQSARANAGFSTPDSTLYVVLRSKPTVFSTHPRSVSAKEIGTSDASPGNDGC